MSETNGHAVEQPAISIDPAPGFVLAAGFTQRKTRGGVMLSHGGAVQTGEANKAVVIAVGETKMDLGAAIECPCEAGNEIVFRHGMGCSATGFMRFENGHHSLEEDEFVILIRFEDILGVVVEQHEID